MFKLATIRLEWKDIARIIMEVADSSSSVEVVPAREWKGAQFLADSWELSTAKAERLFEYRSLFSTPTALERFGRAVAMYSDDLSRKS